MTGEPYTSYAGPEGPAHFGLEPERIKLYNEQAKERIAAEKAAEKKAEEARLELGSTERKKEKVKGWWYKINHHTWGGGF